MTVLKGSSSTEKDLKQVDGFSAIESDVKTKHVTVQPVGSNRAALDVIPKQLFAVASDAVEAGSTDRLIVATGHVAKIGDVIRFTSGTNDRVEAAVQFVDANNIILGVKLESAPLVADTFNVMRHTTLTTDSDGALSVSSGPLQFVQDGGNVTVTEDTVTPANNIPLPVKLVDLTGDITVTANELNVHMQHDGANFDSMRIGDGTNLAAVNGSNELQIADDTARTSLSSIDGKLQALGQNTMANSMPMAIASDQSAIPTTVASLPLPTGAATEATLSSLDGKDFSTETTLAAMSNKIPATLGQKTMAASMAVAIASDQSDLSITASSLPLPTGAATEATLSSIDGKDFATQTTLASIAAEDFSTEATLSAMSAKLPASLGAQTSANSLSVVQASDANYDVTTQKFYPVELIRNDYSSTNVTTGAYVQLVASLVNNINEMHIFDSSGQTLVIATGAAASEVDQFYVFPGGNGKVEVDPAVFASSTRVSIKAISADATAGEISINLHS